MKKIYTIERYEDDMEIKFFVLNTKGEVESEGDEVRVSEWLKANLQ